jgi:hypothetical protein
VGLLCDYFAASTDDIAASTIDWVGGPSLPGKAAKRGLFRRGPSPEPFRAVGMKGIEPTVQMATLEALLTGRALDENLQKTMGLTIAERDRGERVVVRLTDTLKAALAHATDEELDVAVDRWAQTEEFWGQGDPAILRPQVRELAEIARNAAQQGLRLYCWVSL